MFTSAELDGIADEFGQYIGAISGLGADLVLYRLTGTVEGTIAAQSARIEADSFIGENNAGAARTAAGKVFVMMPADADILKDDRFAFDGQAFIVTAIRPNRQIRTWAEAEVIQP